MWIELIDIQMTTKHSVTDYWSGVLFHNLIYSSLHFSPLHSKFHSINPSIINRSKEKFSFSNTSSTLCQIGLIRFRMRSDECQTVYCPTMAILSCGCLPRVAVRGTVVAENHVTNTHDHNEKRRKSSETPFNQTKKNQKKIKSYISIKVQKNQRSHRFRFDRHIHVSLRCLFFICPRYAQATGERKFNTK